jgi:hypothetical protein
MRLFLLQSRWDRLPKTCSLEIVSMNRNLLLFVLALFLTTPGFLAREAAAQAASNTPSATAPQYRVMLLEFQWKPGTDPGWNQDQPLPPIKELVEGGKVEWHELFQVSCLDGVPTSLQVGRTVAVQKGVMQTPQGGKVRQMEIRQVGTRAEIRASSQERGVLVELDYESSRIPNSNPEEDSDTQPATHTLQTKTVARVTLGQPYLVSGTSNKEGSRLILLVVPTR